MLFVGNNYTTILNLNEKDSQIKSRWECVSLIGPPSDNYSTYGGLYPVGMRKSYWTPLTPRKRWECVCPET